MLYFSSIHYFELASCPYRWKWWLKSNMEHGTKTCMKDCR